MGFLSNLFSSKKEYPDQPEILLEESSPCCPITAIVEQDNRVAYFYLWGPEQSQFGMKSCWIRNVTVAPEVVDNDSVKKGISPMLPRAFCKYPEGQEKLRKENLRIVWTEEGDGAALLSDDEVIAIIPSWGHRGVFFGYARDCIGESNFAWELTASNEMLTRIKESEEFWNSWDAEINPFQIEQPKILEIYDDTFGKGDQYFAIDSDKGAPRGLYLRNGDSKIVFATVALSLWPMPQIEMYAKDRFTAHRIELGLMLNTGLSDQEIQQTANWISGTATIPWENITFLSEGHTVHFNPFNHARFKSVLLTSKLSVLPIVSFPTFRQSTIQFLWMVPISDKEQQDIIQNGSEHMINRLNNIGEQIFSLNREEVI